MWTSKRIFSTEEEMWKPRVASRDAMSVSGQFGFQERVGRFTLASSAAFFARYPRREDISRADYDNKLVAPLRVALQDRKSAAKVILTVYGVPLRVGVQLPNADEKAQLEKLGPELDAARKKVAELET